MRAARLRPEAVDYYASREGDKEARRVMAADTCLQAPEGLLRGKQGEGGEMKARPRACRPQKAGPAAEADERCRPTSPTAGDCHANFSTCAIKGRGGGVDRQELDSDLPEDKRITRRTAKRARA